MGAHLSRARVRHEKVHIFVSLYKGMGGRIMYDDDVLAVLSFEQLAVFWLFIPLKRGDRCAF